MDVATTGCGYFRWTEECWCGFNKRVAEFGPSGERNMDIYVAMRILWDLWKRLEQSSILCEWSYLIQGEAERDAWLAVAGPVGGSWSNIKENMETESGYELLWNAIMYLCLSKLEDMRNKCEQIKSTFCGLEIVVTPHNIRWSSNFLFTSISWLARRSRNCNSLA